MTRALSEPREHLWSRNNLCALWAASCKRLFGQLSKTQCCPQMRTQSQMCFASAKVRRWTRESGRLICHITITPKPVSAEHLKDVPRTASRDAHGAMPQSQRHALPFSVPRAHCSPSPLFSQVFNYTQEKKKVLFCLQNLMCSWWDALCFFSEVLVHLNTFSLGCLSFDIQLRINKCRGTASMTEHFHNGYYVLWLSNHL